MSLRARYFPLVLATSLALGALGMTLMTYGVRGPSALLATLSAVLGFGLFVRLGAEVANSPGGDRSVIQSHASDDDARQWQPGKSDAVPKSLSRHEGHSVWDSAANVADRRRFPRMRPQVMKEAILTHAAGVEKVAQVLDISADGSGIGLRVSLPLELTLSDIVSLDIEERAFTAKVASLERLSWENGGRMGLELPDAEQRSLLLHLAGIPQ